MSTKLDPVADAVIQAYTAHDKSLQEIAKVYDCSVGTVRNLLISKGIRRRRQGKPKKGGDVAVPVTPTLTPTDPAPAV